LGSYQIGGCFCGPSYFTGADGTGRVVSSGGNSLIVWKVNDDGNATLAEESKSPSLQTGQDSGFFTSVSSNGTQAGSAIIWAVSRPIERKTSNVLLYAIDASNAKIIISSVAGTWPEVDANANIVPTIANGRVYVASYKELAIFGIGNPISPPILAQLNEFRTQSIADVNQWPNLQSGEHAIYGTVRDINGSTLIVEKRDRTMVNVDIGEANLRHNVAAPEIGHGALIRGRYDDGGTLVATAVLHAKSQPALWRDDH
jgi:hypothetical protein